MVNGAPSFIKLQGKMFKKGNDNNYEQNEISTNKTHDLKAVHAKMLGCY